MAIKKRACAFHADRVAIGVCVITKQPICAECSTRYQGVNYSKEGLRILRVRQADSAKNSRQSDRLITTVCVLATPALLYLVALFYQFSVRSLIDLQQWPGMK